MCNAPVDLVTLVRLHGVGPKLAHAVIAARGWRRANHKTGDEGEWFARWPEFSLELEAAIRQVRGL